MDFELIVGFGLIVLALALACGAWYNEGRKSKALDRLGERYRMKRWDRETNEHFLDRIRVRIDIVGGIKKRTR